MPKPHVSMRLDPDLLAEIEDLAEGYGVDRTAMFDLLLRRGLGSWSLLDAEGADRLHAAHPPARSLCELAVKEVTPYG